MPARKKPPGTQQEPRRAQIVKLEPPSLIPKAPATLLAETRSDWDAFWASEIAGAVKPHHVPALERLFIYRDDWRRLRSVYRKKPIDAGYKGQAVISPAAAQMLRLETAMGALEAKLGLTPYDQQRLGIAIGQHALTAAEVNALAAYEDGDETEAEVIDIEAEWA